MDQVAERKIMSTNHSNNAYLDIQKQKFTLKGLFGRPCVVKGVLDARWPQYYCHILSQCPVHEWNVGVRVPPKEWRKPFNQRSWRLCPRGLDTSTTWRHCLNTRWPTTPTKRSKAMKDKCIWLHCETISWGKWLNKYCFYELKNVYS